MLTKTEINYIQKQRAWYGRDTLRHGDLLPLVIGGRVEGRRPGLLGDPEREYWTESRMAARTNLSVKRRAMETKS